MADNRTSSGRFQAGRSGNPAGKPVGAKHRATALVEKLLGERAEEVIKRVVDDALAGQGLAQRLVMERLYPPPRPRHFVQIALPVISSVADLPLALASVGAALGEGKLSVEDATAIADIFRAFSDSIHTAEIENRLRLVEGELAAQKDRSHGLRVV
jgi:hypothetical protein